MREGTLEWYKKIFSEILKDDMTQYQNQIDSWQLLLNMKQDLGFEDKEIRDYAMKISQYTHKMADYVAGQTGSGKFNDLYYKLLLLEAQNYQVDSGLLYLEKNRVPKERFYEPRREVFIKHQIIQSLQDLMDDKLDIFALSVPPGCGKSTLEDFFLSLVGGWFPNDFNLSSAHSSILTRSLYDGVLEIINDPVEYTGHEIFPNVKLTGTNAKETTVNLERNGRFKTWTFRSIDGSLTGATRCNRFLTADDLVSGIEEALNKSRLETLWTKVVNDLRSRRLEGCKEIYIATRWSVHDPIGKLQQLYEGNPKARFIAVPALNEDGESNFMFQRNTSWTLRNLWMIYPLNACISNSRLSERDYYFLQMNCAAFSSIGSKYRKSRQSLLLCQSGRLMLYGRCAIQRIQERILNLYRLHINLEKIFLYRM